MAHLYLAAPQKSSGKTTLSIGICRALRDRGLSVQPFKKGPDYIDPLWLSQAAGRACYNLDFHTMDRAAITAAFARELGAADLGLIEGNVGLFDSTDLAGANSNAELARLLHAPVVLVVNCQGMARGIAPLLLGYRAFDPTLNLAGVILNKVGGARHAANLIAVVEHYTDLPVLGVLHRDEGIGIVERHLGLVPSNEAEGAEDWIEAIRRRVVEQIDLERLIAIAGTAPRPDAPVAPSPSALTTGTPLRIGIARDAAFGFYYPDDLRALAAGGAELVPFSPLADAEPPPVDALFLGGGFPESHMRALESNRSMRQGIAAFIAEGGPVYAECGGLMYLCTGIRWKGERRAMVGALRAEVEMRPQPQWRGYVRLRETDAFPWPRAPHAGPEISAHEFHHSAVVQPDPSWTYGYQVLRGMGIDGAHDGIVQGNLLACYSHLRAVGGNPWTDRFLAHVRRCFGA
ncbi:cobyrinate a,c-diamide synthase [Thiobaca trueperi]|uniref:Cobyrinate a,c-diamide synthase n=1 Tax=Thiobaca trueperi TaxID=127458 RepID=A0A4R3MVY1_9GAMM|nr:cobyrinate a,c-diamide synthase [Thiobaca trueperi]TCT18893.1 hydrogenobyrinic acid a,c-diamide synthase (glutamine-hydrolysing) /cobyrinate a,c-diamide synthase [Thiobaca trueperi]